MKTKRTVLSLWPVGVRRGVTLIEILIVLSIVALIGLLVIPSQSQVSASRCRNAARLLVSDIEYAQMCSFGNGIDPCMIVFDTQKSAYFLARNSDPETVILDPGTGLSYLTEYGSGRASAMAGVRIESVDAPGEILEFNALGALTQAGDVNIVLRHENQTRRVTIDAVMGLARTN